MTEFSTEFSMLKPWYKRLIPEHPALRTLLRWAVMGALASPPLARSLMRSAAVWAAVLFALYMYLRSNAVSKPYSAAEMALWLDSQDTATTATLLASLVTVVGFVVAFNIAHSAWRAQRRTEIRLAAGEEISTFFREAVDDLSCISSYASDLIRLRKKIAEGEAREDYRWLAQRILHEEQNYLSARGRISEALSEVHRLKGTHFIVLSHQPFATSLYEKAMWYLQKASANLYFVAPIGNDIDFLYWHMEERDETRTWQAFVDDVDQNDSACVAVVAALRALFLSDVFKPNFWSALSARNTSRIILPPRKRHDG